MSFLAKLKVGGPTKRAASPPRSDEAEKALMKLMKNHSLPGAARQVLLEALRQCGTQNVPEAGEKLRQELVELRAARYGAGGVAGEVQRRVKAILAVPRLAELWTAYEADAFGGLKASSPVK